MVFPCKLLRILIFAGLLPKVNCPILGPFYPPRHSPPSPTFRQYMQQLYTDDINQSESSSVRHNKYKYVFVYLGV
jgi:hypothetical protein